MLRGKLTLLLISTGFSLLSAKQPHIVLILADDYGWNDIGYHGSKEVKTPHMDQLAKGGVKLENHYVQPLCSPTRGQLLSGRHDIHTGLQHLVLIPGQPNGLPLDHPTLADQLRTLGYATHIIGKWHLGFHKKEYTPLYRGFDTHFGYLGGLVDYYNYTACFFGICGFDFQHNGKPTLEFQGQYLTNLFTSYSEKLIDNHNASQPMFMYLSHSAPHDPLQAPQHYIDQFQHIKDEKRRTYLAMVFAMDEGIGNITAALKRNNMWDDTLIVFLSDNGGSLQFGASNYPLRGEKGDHWEGAIRGCGFLAGGYVKNKGEINHQLLHVSDWYPTLINLAGGNASNVTNLDGFDQWETITENSPNQRQEILINIDELAPRIGKTVSKIFDTRVRSALRQGDWKIITGRPKLDILALYKKVTEMTPKKEVPGSLWSFFSDMLDHVFDWLNTKSDPLKEYEKASPEQQDTKNVYLFNIAEDPEEKYDLSEQHPEIVDQLLMRLAYYNSTAVPANFPPVDKRSDPSKLGGFWNLWIED